MSGARYAPPHLAVLPSVLRQDEALRRRALQGALPRADALPTPDSIPGTLLEVLRLRAGHDPGGLALADPLGTESAEQLLSLSGQVGELLHARGIRAQDRVACVSRSSPALARWIVGIGCHAAVVPLDPGLGEPAVQALMHRVGVRLLVADGPQTDAARAAARALGIPVLEGDMAGLARQSRSRPSIQVPRPDRSAQGSGFGVPEPDSILLVLSSSGTTGQPKLVPHTQHAMLWRCGQHQHPDQVMDLRGWVNPMPLHHAFGIYCLLKSLLWGTVYCALDGFVADEFAGWVQRIDADVYGATPLIHAELLRAMDQNPALLAGWRPRTIFSSSAPLSAQGLQALLERFGAPVQVNYGMTECALTVQVTCPGQGADTSVGRAVPGVVRVVDSSGRPLPVGEVGEVVTRGPTVFRGYLDDPDLTARSFRDGWFLTGDLGRLDPEHRLFLVGRGSLLVNRGGAKVSPAEIEAWLVSQPGVRLAVALGVPHPSLGEDLVAAVVPHAGEPLEVDALRRAMLAELPGYKVPSRLIAVDDLPLGPAGKVRREGLAELLRPALVRPHRSPSTAAEQRAVACLAQALGRDVDAISMDANFFELGGHSLLAARMMAALEAETGQRVALGLFLSEPTAQGLAVLLESVNAFTCHTDIEPFRGGDGVPLLCLPGYNGHAHYLRALLPFLPPDMPVLGVGAPVRVSEDLQPIARIAAHCVARIREAGISGPYRLMGFSFGGVVAHEVACQLQAQGESVESLVLLDSPTGLDSHAPARFDQNEFARYALGRHDPGVFEGVLTLFRSWSRPLHFAAMPALGWEHLARQGVAVFDLPTTHTGLMQPGRMAQWGPLLARILTSKGGAGSKGAGGAPGASPAPEPDARVAWSPMSSQVLRARRDANDARWLRLLLRVPLLVMARPVPVWAAQWLVEMTPSARPWRLWNRLTPWLARRWTQRQVVPALPAALWRLTGRVQAGASPHDDLDAADAPWLPHQRPETLLLARGVRQHVSGDTQGARETLDALEQMMGDRAELRVALVHQLMLLGWDDEMRRQADRMPADAPASAQGELSGLLCRQARRDTDWGAAARHARNAVRDLPMMPFWHAALIEALAALGRHEEAARARSEALERFPEHGGYRADLERVLHASV